MSGKFWWRFVWVAGAFGSLWLGGFLQFVAGLPVDVEDPASRTDAIIVLTGGAERLNTGLSLLNGGKAERMLISGVAPGTTVATLKARSQLPTDKFACCVELDEKAPDTVGNAIETALWMARSGYDSLRLVTASYHMPRSLLLFASALPEARVVAHPVFSEHVKVDAWWRNPGTARLLALEYNKYLASLAKVRLTGGGTADKARAKTQG